MLKNKYTLCNKIFILPFQRTSGKSLNREINRYGILYGRTSRLLAKNKMEGDTLYIKLENKAYYCIQNNQLQNPEIWDPASVKEDISVSEQIETDKSTNEENSTSGKKNKCCIFKRIDSYIEKNIWKIML
ncbi:hypothetical protein POWCR01_030005300 [Plasmodium ovale]|uniref:Uncharacterized protein n=1 Tax=Plasmodium ovale TaxID=36330 RepID=A0A1C3KMZ8_PLAOA|nr:hypothetical protein POWCR01_030005300 [Plasmodium ovale]